MTLRSLSDPSPNYKYGLEIGGVLVAGFTACSGLEVSRETLEVVEGGINDHVHVLPGPLQHGHITFKRGITFTSFLWEWFHWGMFDTAVLRLPVVVFRYDVSGIPVSIFPILDAYPVKWEGEGLRADGHEAALETLEIAFGGRSAGGETVRRMAAEGTPRSASLGGSHGDSGGADLGDDQKRELASKVLKLLKDTVRVERERAGKVGGY
jgi:phage tail-like protein